MKKNYLFLFLFLLFASLSTFSQPKAKEVVSYRVNLDELKMTVYEKDSTANALVLYEYGNSYVDQRDYDLTTEKKFKVKLLNREGFDNATITIHLYNNDRSSEKIEAITATTYSLVDGNVETTKLTKENIFKERYNENYTLVKFTLPNIKEGSVITYSYKLISPFMYKYHGWEFQGQIPKLYSEYNTSIPANWTYNIKLVGGKKLATNTSDIKKNCLSVSGGGHADCAISKYVMKDIPAFIEEDYMTSESNYLSRIDYELMTFKGFDGSIHNYTKTWETVDKELRTDPNIGKQLNKSVPIEDLLTTNITDEQDELKKANAIYKYVQEEYTWNEEYKIFKDVSVKNLIKNKSGNISSINILLHNLLKSCKINVKPILLSTRENGLPTKIFPVISDFNYLIVQATINDKTYLLDATDKFLSFGQIPFKCLNQYGRLLDLKNGSKWIDIKPEKSSAVQYKATLNLNENGNITGKVTSKRTNYHALKCKKAYKSKENYLKTLEDNNPNIEITNHNVTRNESHPDFLENYDIKYPYDNTGGNIYLSPFFIKLFKENPFKLQERTYPIDFGYINTYYYILRLNFGKEYSILEKPKDLNIALPNNTGQFIFSCAVNNNSMNILMRINIKEALYPSEYYPYLKAFFNKIIDSQNNSLIVLQKNK
ncbi:DUF3857 domain-containing protein [Snuella sedimenti]|uniref:DUF3857 domain-containing protein n=1 Tax=Snuella sedimenti TaxID=2798802 RepID=A0A8J7IF10_9FLAO|nr:DUF3857 domain-containing protein [Snuella sedimenti]MBJ6367202.1 DUF3857 domain-containing protein [Snuella sedimenti]